MKITAREKKFIVYGGALIAAVMLIYWITLQLPDRESPASQVEQKKAMLLKHREMLGQEEIYKNRVEQYTLHLEKTMTRLLPGDNPNVAEADLQKLLMSFAEQSGVEINRKNTLPDKEMEDNLIKVSVNIEVNCNLEQLVRFLTAIHNYDKYLEIEQFQITGFQTQRRQQIRPNLTVVGYINSKEPESNESLPESAGATDGPPDAVVEQLEE